MRTLTMYCLLSVASLSVNAANTSDEMKLKQAECGELSSYPRLAGCYQSLWEESDVQLNREYAALVSYLSGTNRENLIDAQLKWVRFRDADCFFSEPRARDDSIASASRVACLADRTIERLRHLENYSAPWNKGCNGCPW